MVRQSGKTISLILYKLILLSLTSTLFASAPINNKGEIDRDFIKHIISQLHQGTFDSVFYNSHCLQNNYPEDPIGFILEAVALQTIMRDYRVRLYESRLDSLIECSIKRAKIKAYNNPTAENYFILGAAQGHSTAYCFRCHKWFKAIKDAFQSLKNLNYALRLNPNFIDPLLGIALFSYAKKKIMFGIFSDEKVISDIIKVQQYGKFLSIDASYTLLLIYFERGEMDKAKMINDHLFMKFPGNPTCLYNRALILEKLGDYPEAAQIWKKLVHRIELSYPSSHNYLCECHFHISQICRQLEVTDAARYHLLQACYHARNYQAKNEIDGPYDSFKQIRMKINRVLREKVMKPF